MSPKPKTLRARNYLDALRLERCLISGRKGDERESVVPAHIGTGGMGLKSADCNAIPLLNSLHQEAHRIGMASMLRERAPDWLLLSAFTALAQKIHAEWEAQR